MNTQALEFINVTKRFGNFEAVKNLSFSIKAGEVFGLLGPNGAGKSTSINMIVGLNRITSGKIEVFGKDVTKHSIETRQIIGLMYQEIIGETFLKVQESLELHCGYFGVSLDREWMNELLSRLALIPHRAKKTSQLSGGMKRRLMMAKALIHKPTLLILDEPTAGVDVDLRRIIWEFVNELNKNSGTTVLLTTHYLEEAEKLCSRVAIMDHGQLLILEDTKKLIHDQNMANLEEVFLRLTKEGNSKL